MPFFDDVLGHEAVIARLRAALAQADRPHAWLFHGPAGIGKARVARAAAAALLCTGPPPSAAPCGTCPACRQCAAGSHPDFFDALPAREGATRLEAKDIRENLIGWVQKSPLLGSVKVALLRDADRLTLQAFNALLKILEEPPAGTTLILSGESIEGIPATVRSRCTAVAFGPLPAGVVERVLKGLPGVKPEDAAAAAAVSGGSIPRGRAALAARAAGWLPEAERWLDGAPPRPAEFVERLRTASLAGDKGGNARRVHLRDAFDLLLEIGRGRLAADGPDDALPRVFRLDRLIAAQEELRLNWNMDLILDTLTA